MTDSAWVSIAAFANVADAEAASRKLADADIESLILGPDDQPVTKEYVGQCYVWIPEELTEDADLALNPPTFTEEELAELALQSPPPDDA